MAHITGGGLLENLPRSLPDDLGAEITGHPALPNVFKWMKDTSGLDDGEMLRTFNCGVGMVLILDAKDVVEAKKLLLDSEEEQVFDLGVVSSGGEIKMANSLS